jgi:hypothetical protein
MRPAEIEQIADADPLKIDFATKGYVTREQCPADLKKLRIEAGICRESRFAQVKQAIHASGGQAQPAAELRFCQQQSAACYTQPIGVDALAGSYAGSIKGDLPMHFCVS